MDYPKFQIAVIELAEEGTSLTAANVVARLRIAPDEADAHLARMARDGRLEREVDADSGVLEYRVRGLSRKSGGKRALDDLEAAIGGDVLAKAGTAALGIKKQKGGQPLPLSLRRKVKLGVALGFFLPGFGLAYAAPWTITAVASVVFVVGFKILSLIPFLSGMLTVGFVALFAVASAVLGGLYTWQYNQMGRRAALGDEPTSPKQLLSRARAKG